MTKKDWYRALSLADEKYIAEAHPDRTVLPKRNRALLSLAAACACIALIAASLWLFIPFPTDLPDVSQYADSEYYGLIEKLNVLTFQPPKYKNNAAKLFGSLKNLAPTNIGSLSTDVMMGDSSNGSGGYREVTDNQTAGVIEADRIKRSDTHIYYLDGQTLRVYSIDSENSRELGSFDLSCANATSTERWELYLSEDGGTVTVIRQYTVKTENESGVRCVNLVSLDVGDPGKIEQKDSFTITGSYRSSRKTDGGILLLTEFALAKGFDFGEESTFLPQIDEGEGFYSIPLDGIVIPENLKSARYTVVTKLDGRTLDLCETAAYLSYSGDAYVSESHVFLTHAFSSEKQNANGTLTRDTVTEISVLSYGGERLEKKGSVTVRGSVLNRFSMDEHEGVLRVFTTTNTATYKRSHKNGYSEELITVNFAQTGTDLYCVDLTTLETVASVIGFAPPGEEIRSVRFDGEIAYVCTSVKLSDPVFFFDLSDLGNITYKDTGTIAGFSTSLIHLGDGYLLGIGRGESMNTLKIEVYEETANGVRIVDSYEWDRASYSTEYKSYYVDRENCLIGLGIEYRFSRKVTRYVVLHFDGYELTERVNVSLEGKPEDMRGVCIDGYLYMFGSNDFKVKKLFD